MTSHSKHSRRMRHFGHFGLFSKSNKCRPRAAGLTRPSMALEYVGMDIPASFGDSNLNTGRTIRLFVRPNLLCAVLDGICRHKREKCQDPCWNRSPEIPPKAAAGGVFGSFIATTSDRKYVMTSHPVWLGQMVFEMFHELISCRTNEWTRWSLFQKCETP